MKQMLIIQYGSVLLALQDIKKSSSFSENYAKKPSSSSPDFVWTTFFVQILPISLVLDANKIPNLTELLAV